MDLLNRSPDKLVLAIIQSQDSNDACQSLGNINISSFQLPSSGGFLGLQNTTLLMRATSLLWKTIIQTLKLTCKQRVEYKPINTSEMMSLAGLSAIQVTVGGATIFSIDVEHYEEL
ncbi:MAG: cyclic-di-AMP receptor [Anaerolineaceae bacterium]